MAAPIKHVVHVYLAHPVYAEILAARPDVRLDRIESHGGEDAAAPLLAAAHAYQIGSARDEIAPQYHAGKPLFERMPELLIVSATASALPPDWLSTSTPASVQALTSTVS